jgi:hypothetical protein
MVCELNPPPLARWFKVNDTICAIGLMLLIYTLTLEEMLMVTLRYYPII